MNFPLSCALMICLLAFGCGDRPQAAGQPAQQGSSATPSAGESAPPPEQTGGFDGARAFAHVEQLVRIGPRPPASEGIRRAQEYIRGQLESFGCAIEDDNFEAQTPIGRVPMKNITAKVPGGKSDVVLLLTHYDTMRREGFVGANDGGSSTGLMLEMARLLCAKPRELSVWIAFLDGEEALVRWSDNDSLYGSRRMAAKLAVSGELKRVKAVLLADLVGDREIRFLREANSTRWLTDLVWDTAQRLGYGRIFVDEVHAIEDDHLPFVRRGVPAVDVIELGEYAYHHTNEDTLGKLSARSLAITGHVFLESLAALERHLR